MWEFNNDRIMLLTTNNVITSVYIKTSQNAGFTGILLSSLFAISGFSDSSMFTS